MAAKVHQTTVTWWNHTARRRWGVNWASVVVAMVAMSEVAWTRVDMVSWGARGGGGARCRGGSITGRGAGAGGCGASTAMMVLNWNVSLVNWSRFIDYWSLVVMVVAWLVVDVCWGVAVLNDVARMVLVSVAIDHVVVVNICRTDVVNNLRGHLLVLALLAAQESVARLDREQNDQS